MENISTYLFIRPAPLIMNAHNGVKLMEESFASGRDSSHGTLSPVFLASNFNIDFIGPSGWFTLTSRRHGGKIPPSIEWPSMAAAAAGRKGLGWMD
jgi:hypothetical protein